MSLKVCGYAKRLFIKELKARYPLLKAALHRGEQCLGETGRHVSKRRGKCLLRFSLDVRECPPSAPMERFSVIA